MSRRERFDALARSGVGGQLPDILDPAYRNPRHRGRAYSVIIASTGIKLLNDDLDRRQARCLGWARYCIERQQSFMLLEKICRFLAGPSEAAILL